MAKTIHALVGKDIFLHVAALRQIVATMPEGTQRIDVDGETAELADVLDELRSFAMFSSTKLVVVRSADDFISRFREPLEPYFEKPAQTATLVLRCDSMASNTRIYKLIAKAGQFHDCNAPKQITDWIVKQAKSVHNLTIPFDAAARLADQVGDDLGRLDMELSKLALQCDGRVDAAAITQGVAFQREQEMWKMTDEVAAGRTAEALRRWRQLVQLDSSAEYRGMTWLTIWLEKARKTAMLKRAGKRDGEIASALKIWPSQAVPGFMKTVGVLGETGVARLINLLAELDYRSKSGRGQMIENVERFILAAGK